jgi:hypothetical protein
MGGDQGFRRFPQSTHARPMGKHKPASARAPHPSNVARDKALREPERKALREQLGDGDAALKGLAGEPVLDLAGEPVLEVPVPVCRPDTLPG